MKRAYQCVTLGYVPSCPAYTKRSRRPWRFSDFAACFLLKRKDETSVLAACLQRIHAEFSTPLKDGYRSAGWSWIIAHAVYLFHQSKASGHLGALVCVSIATKLHDDFSPETGDDVYQSLLSETEKRLFGALESRVFLQDLSGRVMFPKRTILSHFQACARECNAPTVPVE